jgi:hypothetical protein
MTYCCEAAFVGSALSAVFISVFDVSTSLCHIFLTIMCIHLFAFEFGSWMFSGFQIVAGSAVKAQNIKHI